MRKLGKIANKALAYALSLALGVTSFVVSMPKTVKADVTPLQLGEATFDLDGLHYSLNELVLKTDDTILNIAITVDSGSISTAAINMSDYGTVKRFKDDGNTTYILNFATPLDEATAQALLRKVVFEVADSVTTQVIKIRLNNYNTQNIADGAHITSLDDENGKTHYYMFVEAENITWVQAYNTAKTYQLMGMKGYLATITNAKEDEILDKVVSQEAGWAGGIRKAAYATDADSLTEPAGRRLDFDGDTLENGTLDLNNTANYKKYVWACGPEAGKTFGVDTDQCSYNNWNTNEPNNNHKGNDEERDLEHAEGCLQIHYVVGDDRYWNDLPNETNANNPVVGYFVEFGGYPTDSDNKTTDPGFKDEPNRVIDEETLSVDPKDIKVTVNGTIGGTNKEAAKKVVFIAIDDTKYEGAVAGDGTYSISEVPNGSYKVKVLDENGNDLFATPSSADVLGNRGETVTKNFDVNATVAISGTIGGNAAKDVTKVTFTDGDVVVDADVAADGTYSIPRIPEGTYTVTVDAPGATVNPATQTVTAGKTTDYNMDADYNTVTVSGHIYGTGADDAKTAVLVKDGEVVAKTEIGSTSKDFAFTDSVPVGTYDILIEDANGSVLDSTPNKITIPVDAVGNHKITPDINVNKTIVAVDVTGDLKGDGEEDAETIELTDGVNTYPGTITTDPVTGEKTYDVPRVPAGEYDVVVKDKDEKPLTTDPAKVTVPANPTAPVTQEITVEKEKPATVPVSGKITGTGADDAKTVELTDGTKTYPVDVTKDSEGKPVYNVPEVPAGTYNVVVKDKDGNPLKTNPDPTKVTVAGTDPVTKDVAVEKAAPATVPVSGKITGTGADDAKTVELTDGTKTYPVDVTKDSEGKPVYNVPEVPAGTYNVVVKDKDGNPLKTNPDPTKVTVSGTDPVTKDVAVEKAQPKTTDVIGDVLGDDKDEVKTITLVDPDGKEYPANITTDPKTGEVTYGVPNVPAGEYDIVAKDKDGVPMKINPDQSKVTVPENPTSAVVADITPEKVDPEKVSISGKVTGTNASAVQDVILTPVTPGKEPIKATLNKNNEYSMKDVPVGTYLVTATDADGKPVSVTPGSFEVKADKKDGYDISAEKGTTTVNGKLEGPAATDADHIVLKKDDKTYPGIVHTDAKGDKTYDVPGVPAGTYDVVVEDKDGKELATEPAKVIVPENPSMPFVQDITVDQKKNPEPVKVKVSGKITGPNADASSEVILAPNGDMSKALSADVNKANGYTIENVPEGTYKVLVWDKDKKVLNSTPGEFTVVATKQDGYDIVVNYSNPTVSGKVEGPAADKADKVELTDGKNTYPGNVTTDPKTGEKTYEIPNVPAGNYDIAVKDKDGNPLKADPNKVEVPANSTEPVTKNLSVKPVTVDVNGNIRGTMAEPVEEVVLKDKDGKEYPANVTKDNEYSIPKVPVGEYDVIVKDKDGNELPAKPYPEKITVTADPNATYDIIVDDPNPEKLSETKEDAKKELDKDADDAKKDIDDNPFLDDQKKDDIKKDIDAAKDDADKKIDEAKDNTEVRDAEKEAEDKIQKILDDALNDAKDEAKKEIDALPSLTPEDKKEYKDDIDKAKKPSEVKDILDDAVKDNAMKTIDALPNLTPEEKKSYKYDVETAKTPEEMKDAVDKAIKADAKKEIDKKAADADKAIDEIPNLPEDQKKAAKDEVAKEATKAKDAIDKAKTPDEVKKAKEDGKKAIDDIVAKAKPEDPYANLTDEEKKILATTQTVAETEKAIFNTNTDKNEVSGAKFYQLRLRAYGKNKAVKLKWIKQSGADGYIIYGAACGNKYKKIKTIKNGKTTTWTQKKLKKAKYYKYMIVAYKNIAGEKRAIAKSISAHATTDGGKRGNPTSVSVKKTKITIKKGKKYQLKASYKSKKKVSEHISIIRYESTNKKVATVTKKGGKVKAVGKGTCTIYVHAQNGFWKKVKVTVK